MIVLFTDFGLEGPYIGQVQTVLQQQAPGIPVINLFSDLMPFEVQGAACLLPAAAVRVWWYRPTAAGMSVRMKT